METRLREIQDDLDEFKFDLEDKFEFLLSIIQRLQLNIQRLEKLLDPKTLILSLWEEILSEVKKEKVTTHAWLVAGELADVTTDEILLNYKSKIHCDTVMKNSNKQLIEQVIRKITGRSYQIRSLLKQVI